MGQLAQKGKEKISVDQYEIIYDFPLTEIDCKGNIYADVFIKSIMNLKDNYFHCNYVASSL